MHHFFSMATKAVFAKKKNHVKSAIIHHFIKILAANFMKFRICYIVKSNTKSALFVILKKCGALALRALDASFKVHWGQDVYICFKPRTARNISGMLE